jgi:hypothetical protein
VILKTQGEYDMTTRWFWTAAAGLTFAVAGFAQAQQAQEPADVLIHKEVRVVGGPMVEGAGAAGAIMYHQAGPMTMDFIGAEMSFGDKTVKGAPYSADAVTETTQTFPDGNRITRKTTASLYRDSQGRTRREESLGAIGPWAAAGDSPKHIFVSDPVADVSYMLDPQTHSAQKILTVKDKFFATDKAGPGTQTIMIRRGTANVATGSVGQEAKIAAEATFELPVAKGSAPDIKNESLGKQTIEGVAAEGTRSTITIPAGAIGNELPIQSVSERWYSPELQTIVMTKRSDLRFGETVYRLTNIQRTEPPSSLFELPADYTVNDMSIMNEKMNRARKLADEGK